jgi:hypothetical protein
MAPLFVADFADATAWRVLEAIDFCVSFFFFKRVCL